MGRELSVLHSNSLQELVRVWLCFDQECPELLWLTTAHTLYTPLIGWSNFTTNEHFIIITAQLLSSVIEYLCTPCTSHQSDEGYY